MQPLLKLNDPQQLSSGLWPDSVENQEQLWKEGTNILFDGGNIRKLDGWSRENSTAAVVTGLANSYGEGERRTYLGAGPELRKSVGGVNTLIGSGYASTGKWVLEPFGTFLLATNNVDPPQLWKNTGQAINWPTCPFNRAKIVRKLEIFPILFHGQEVAWPSFNNIEDFVPGVGKRAGQQFIRDIDSDVMAAEPLGSSLVYYTEDMFGFINFIGGESTFGIKTQQGGGIGAVGPKAVVPIGPFHIGFSRKGIWQSDGSSFSYIAVPAVKDWIFGQINWLRADEVVGVHRESLSQVEFFFPCLDGVIRGVGFSYAGPTPGRWTCLEVPVTAYAAQQSGADGPAIGTGLGWGIYGEGRNAGQVAMQSSLKSGPLAMGSTDLLKRWQMVQVFFESSGGFVEFRVGYSNNPQAQPEWTAWGNLSEDNWLEDRESNFITIEFRSTGLGVDWKISGLEFYGVPVGKRR